jgi:ferric-dicitrate binding protein FerR (iron transport regulator)
MNNSHEKKARRIATLLAGYMRDNLTPSEHDELDEWVGASDKNMRLFEELTDERRVQLALELLNDNNQSGLVRKLKDDKDFTFVNRPFRRYKNVAIAVAITIVVGGTSIWFMTSKYYSKSDKSENIVSNTKDKQLPALKSATLFPYNDNPIVLNEKENGIIARQGVSEITKEPGLIRYNEKGSSQITELPNRLVTAKGEYFSIVLSDGTKAWLNANSSINYPASFPGDVRRVAITGDVYFEVASALDKGKNYGKHFFVDVPDRNMSIEVKGTRFNVSAYPEEKVVKTTLVEGSVLITSANKVDSLVPGQQAQVTKDGNIQVVKAEKDVDIAWLDQQLVPDAEDLMPTILAVSRWYNVELDIINPKNTTIKSGYSGYLSLKNTLDQTLKSLNMNTHNATFAFDGKKVTVTVTPS